LQAIPQTPPVQVAVPWDFFGQRLSQAPQLVGSDAVSTHPCRQEVGRSGGQAQVPSAPQTPPS
jgi:hypothetical protein